MTFTSIDMFAAVLLGMAIYWLWQKVFEEDEEEEDKK